MARTVAERLTAIERDVNRILEILQDVVTVDEASEHVRITDEENLSVLYRVNSIENKIEALKYKWQIAYKRVNS